MNDFGYGPRIVVAEVFKRYSLSSMARMASRQHLKIAQETASGTKNLRFILMFSAPRLRLRLPAEKILRVVRMALQNVYKNRRKHGDAVFFLNLSLFQNPEHSVVSVTACIPGNPRNEW